MTTTASNTQQSSSPSQIQKKTQSGHQTKDLILVLNKTQSQKPNPRKFAYETSSNQLWDYERVLPIPNCMHSVPENPAIKPRAHDLMVIPLRRTQFQTPNLSSK